MKAIRLAAYAIGGLLVAAIAALFILKTLDDRHVDQTWQSLEATGSGEVFTAAMVDALPEPARRYFLHAIRPGTPLAASAHLKMSGAIKPNSNSDWADLTATQVLTPGQGFVWKASAQSGPVSMGVVDQLANNSGRMRIALFGLVPVVNEGSADISKSALGRLAIESIWLPSSLLPQNGVTWETVDDRHARATLTVSGEEMTLTLTVDADGRLMEVTTRRYGNQADDGSFQYIPYGAASADERTFGGYTIPTSLRIGWWYGTDRYEESIRLNVEQVEYK